MANPDDWDTKYLNDLKKHYAYDVVNYMFRASDNKFSRPYSLLSLAELYDSQDADRYYDLKKIAEKANELGFVGPNNLIEYGLNSSYEAGLVEIGNDKSYRLHSQFCKWVIEQSKGRGSILSTISKFQTKNSSKRL
jgi:hypothetical protein